MITYLPLLIGYTGGLVWLAAKREAAANWAYHYHGRYCRRGYADVPRLDDRRSIRRLRAEIRQLGRR